MLLLITPNVTPNNYQGLYYQYIFWKWDFAAMLPRSKLTDILFAAMRPRCQVATLPRHYNFEIDTLNLFFSIFVTRML